MLRFDEDRAPKKAKSDKELFQVAYLSVQIHTYSFSANLDLQFLGRLCGMYSSDTDLFLSILIGIHFDLHPF